MKTQLIQRIDRICISEHGESIFLTSGDQGNITGTYSIFQSFDATQNEVTIGRHPTTTATGNGIGTHYDFVQMEYPTMGAANSPIIPKVVINEIRYKAVNKNDALHEYAELFNRSSETIYLYDINNPSNTWKFANGIEFTFPEGSSIASGDHILILEPIQISSGT